MGNRNMLVSHQIKCRTYTIGPSGWIFVEDELRCNVCYEIGKTLEKLRMSIRVLENKANGLFYQVSVDDFMTKLALRRAIEDNPEGRVHAWVKRNLSKVQCDKCEEGKEYEALRKTALIIDYLNLCLKLLQGYKGVGSSVCRKQHGGSKPFCILTFLRENGVQNVPTPSKTRALNSQTPNETLSPSASAGILPVVGSRIGSPLASPIASLVASSIASPTAPVASLSRAKIGFEQPMAPKTPDAASPVKSPIDLFSTPSPQKQDTMQLITCPVRGVEPFIEDSHARLDLNLSLASCPVCPEESCCFESSPRRLDSLRRFARRPRGALSKSNKAVSSRTDLGSRDTKRSKYVSSDHSGCPRSLLSICNRSFCTQSAYLKSVKRPSGSVSRGNSQQSCLVNPITNIPTVATSKAGMMARDDVAEASDCNPKDVVCLKQGAMDNSNAHTPKWARMKVFDRTYSHKDRDERGGRCGAAKKMDSEDLSTENRQGARDKEEDSPNSKKARVIPTSEYLRLRLGDRDMSTGTCSLDSRMDSKMDGSCTHRVFLPAKD
eukprot:Platyproteum_vivax@DN4100_c0_g1_i2.p1